MKNINVQLSAHPTKIEPKCLLLFSWPLSLPSMAKHKKPRTSGCFLGCFGISEVRDQTGSRSNSDKRKSQRWLPLPRVWSKKSGAKTVPVDSTAVVDDVAVADVESEKAEAKRRYDESRVKSKSKVRRSKTSEKLTGPKRRASEAAAATPAASEECKPREVMLFVVCLRLFRALLLGSSMFWGGQKRDGNLKNK